MTFQQKDRIIGTVILNKYFKNYLTGYEGSSSSIEHMCYRNLTNCYIVLESIITSIRRLKVATLTCFDVANYFLALANEDVGDSISNLKLQKLVYYAQGFSLALKGEVLFDDPIEAWAHGPAIRKLYHEYKDNGANAIDKPEDMNFTKYDDDVKSLLNQVYEEYGQFSAWKLRDMSHEEEPWVKGNARTSKVITIKDLKKYFLTQIED